MYIQYFVYNINMCVNVSPFNILFRTVFCRELPGGGSP